MKIRPVEAKLFHGDRHYNPRVAFGNFTKLPKIPHLMPPLAHLFKLRAIK